MKRERDAALNHMSILNKKEQELVEHELRWKARTEEEANLVFQSESKQFSHLLESQFISLSMGSDILVSHSRINWFPRSFAQISLNS